MDYAFDILGSFGKFVLSLNFIIFIIHLSTKGSSYDWASNINGPECKELTSNLKNGPKGFAGFEIHKHALGTAFTLECQEWYRFILFVDIY